MKKLFRYTALIAVAVAFIFTNVNVTTAQSVARSGSGAANAISWSGSPTLRKSSQACGFRFQAPSGSFEMKIYPTLTECRIMYIHNYVSVG